MMSCEATTEANNDEPTRGLAVSGDVGDDPKPPSVEPAPTAPTRRAGLDGTEEDERSDGDVTAPTTEPDEPALTSDAIGSAPTTEADTEADGAGDTETVLAGS